MEINWYENIDLPEGLPQRPTEEYGVTEIPGSSIKLRNILVKETECAICDETIISFERGRWVHVGTNGRTLDHDHVPKIKSSRLT